MSNDIKELNKKLKFLLGKTAGRVTSASKVKMSGEVDDPLILLWLSNDIDDEVRTGVASNINATHDILEKLAYDEFPICRWWVGANQSSSMEALSIISRDQDLVVRRSLLRNPVAMKSKEILARLLENGTINQDEYDIIYSRIEE